MKKYTHILFDLDHTLWDFEANSTETLRELYEEHALARAGVPSFGIYDNDLAFTLSDSYIARCPAKNNLIPYAEDMLHYLANTGYKLHILTNGFYETQMTKLTGTGLISYFDQVITSETAGCTKPDERIFHKMLQHARAIHSDCLMIGDNLEVDIKGARNASIDQVYFNPAGTKHGEQVTYEIACLSEIERML